jgi:L-threonylcarbamoyladenylate synthase
MNTLFCLKRENQNNVVNKCSEQLNVPGSFLLIPTETVYGLVCLWKDEVSRKRIYQAKKRPENKPFQLLVSSVEMLKTTEAIISETTKKIIENFCPGPITLIIPTHGKEKVGFRIPEHEFVISLINKLGSPLAATSANITGEPSALDAATALNTLNIQPDVAIDGGSLPKESLASTVIMVEGKGVKILREGPISLAEIKAVL